VKVATGHALQRMTATSPGGRTIGRVLANHGGACYNAARSAPSGPRAVCHACSIACGRHSYTRILTRHTTPHSPLPFSPFALHNAHSFAARSVHLHPHTYRYHWPVPEERPFTAPPTLAFLGAAPFTFPPLPPRAHLPCLRHKHTRHATYLTCRYHSPAATAFNTPASSMPQRSHAAQRSPLRATPWCSANASLEDASSRRAKKQLRQNCLSCRCFPVPARGYTCSRAGIYRFRALLPYPPPVPSLRFLLLGLFVPSERTKPIAA